MEDPCIEPMVIRGAFLMRQFIKGQYAPPQQRALISWRHTHSECSSVAEAWSSSVQSGKNTAIVTEEQSKFSWLNVFAFLFPNKDHSVSFADIEHEGTTMKMVKWQVRATLAHYRMAIIMVIFGIVLMLAPLKWEKKSFWSPIFRRLPFLRKLIRL